MTHTRTGTALAVIARSSEVLDRFASPETFLAADEIARARLLVAEQARNDFLAAHLVARLCVAYVLNGPLEGVTIRQRCSRCGGPHGRPEVVESSTYVSWAHSSGYVATVVSEQPCGIDIEASHRAVGQLVRKAAFTEAEFELVRAHEDGDSVARHIWLRKEALVKAGLDSLPQLFRLNVMGEPAAFAPESVGALFLKGRSFGFSARRVEGNDICVVTELPVQQVTWIDLPDLIHTVIGPLAVAP